MGASTFITKAIGKTAREAFRIAREDAQYEHGHGGYTGTIAEKTNFVVIKPPADVTISKFAQDLLDDGDPRVNDKWGPAGCIELAPGTFLFFGWASC